MPVAIAGEVSPIQLRIRRFGSFTPALAAPDDVAKLFLLNLLFYLAEMSLLFDVIASLAFVARHPTKARNLPTEEQATGSFAGIDNVTTNFVFLFFITPFLWLALRSVFGQQVRLARNGRRVLRTMTIAAAVTRKAIRGRRSSQDPATAIGIEELTGSARKDLHESAANTLEALLEDLPWLPCFDRRDILVIRELIASSSPEGAPSASHLRALAFSAHAAARMKPAPGDGSARLSIDAWLRGRNIDLDTLTVSSPFSTALRQGLTSDKVLVDDLRALGWCPAPGASSALVAPLGTLAVAHDGLTWTMEGAAPLRRWKFFYVSTAFLLQNIFESLTEGVVFLARGKISDGTVTRCVETPLEYPGVRGTSKLRLRTPAGSI